MDATRGAGTTHPFGSPVLVGFVSLNFSFLCYVFVDHWFFLLVIALSVGLRITSSDYPFGILDLRLLITLLVS